MSEQIKNNKNNESLFILSLICNPNGTKSAEILDRTLKNAFEIIINYRLTHKVTDACRLVFFATSEGISHCEAERRTRDSRPIVNPEALLCESAALADRE